MSLKLRRFLYILFILAFLIIAPLICLYASGYKLKSGYKIQKTGILILDSKPAGANIFLNGKPQQLFLEKYFFQKKSYITTPAKIKSLLPGDYDIRLELNGYWPWQKKLSIKPGKTTFAEDIFLFKDTLPLLKINGAFNNLSLSPNEKYFILQDNNNTTLFNLTNDEKEIYRISTSTILKSESDSAAYSWSPDSQRVIADNLLFNINNWENPIFLSELLGPSVKNYKWFNSDNRLYYSNNDEIDYYDFSTDSHSSIIKSQLFSDYLVKDNLIYLVKSAERTTELNIFNLNNNLMGKINLPDATYTFLHPNHELINLYDLNNQILYIIDPFADFMPLRESLSNVKKTFWVNNEKLLYANNFEIWLLDLNNLNKKLLTRISNNIESIFWHPSNNYIIYATNKNINILELDDREKYNIIKLVELDSIKDVYMDKAGKNLYFYAKIGNQEGLYQLSIQ